MQTKLAWDSGKPIWERLPECYKENDIALWLTAYFDELLINTKAKIDDLPRQLNPLDCDEAWLDVLAPLCGFTGEYWDTTWKVRAKRLLIANSFLNIWPNKGSKAVLSLVLDCFSIQHLISRRGDFIIGFSKAGDPLGSAAWEYIIYLPTIYKNPGNEQFKLTAKLNKLYGPLWCSSEIIFDDSVITTLKALKIANNTILGTGDLSALAV
jgi:hypothetical protein